GVTGYMRDGHVSRSRFAELVPRLRLVRAGVEAADYSSCLVLLGAREDVVPPEPCERGITLDRRGPPNGHRSVFLRDVSHTRGVRFPQAERHDRRRVPELHQPLSRSSRTAFTPAPPGTAGRGIFQNPLGSFPEPSRMSPARA